MPRSHKMDGRPDQMKLHRFQSIFCFCTEQGKLSLAPDAFIRALENSVTCCSIYCKVHGFQVVGNVVPFVMTSDTPSDPREDAHAPPYPHNDL